ncbi:hypothetical protein LguiA_004851 [Lonicera macranthoides]
MMLEWDPKLLLLDFLAADHGMHGSGMTLPFYYFILVWFHSFILEYWGQVGFCLRKGTL